MGRGPGCPLRSAPLVLSAPLPQMVSDIRKYVQHVSLSPDSIQNDEVSGRPAEGWGTVGNGRRGAAQTRGPACRPWPRS